MDVCTYLIALRQVWLEALRNEVEKNSETLVDIVHCYKVVDDLHKSSSNMKLLPRDCEETLRSSYGFERGTEFSEHERKVVVRTGPFLRALSDRVFEVGFLDRYMNS